MSDRSGGGSVVDLRVEYESEPQNVPISKPRFSWRVDTNERGIEQSAYRVLVADTVDALREGRGDVWDSGRVRRAESTNVTYAGPPLVSDSEYYWTVRVWDGEGEPSAYADPVEFSTALADAHEWEGEWIGYQPDAGDSNGYRSQWHSAETEAQEWVQVDLGEGHDVEVVELHPTNPFDGPMTPDGMSVSAVYSMEEDAADRVTTGGPGGFGFPVRYHIETSDDPDFETSRVLVDRTDADQSNPGVEVVTHDIEDSVDRYVRITAVTLYEIDPTNPPGEGDLAQIKATYMGEERRAWRTFALAEFAIRDDDNVDLARDRPIKASSSVEEGAWGREHLVDGITESRTVGESPLLRTEVDLGADVARARAHVCTLGYGELYVNGERVGDEVLNPGWTQYDERVLYSTYDVTDHVTAGANALGLWLGSGWFGRNARDWTGFGSPRAILQVHVEYEDGRTRTVSTDSTWRTDASPLLENDLYDGEVYDAREEQEGWAETGFDDTAWIGATVRSPPGGDLVPQRTPPIRVTGTVEPQEVLDREEGPIVDFGQNLVGWLELSVEGAEAGDEIELRHAEVLLDDGSLALVDLRTADATDTYVARGDDLETYEPRFTYHGFRYAQIVGYPGDLDPSNITAKVVHTDVEQTGSFDCSNEELAQVQQNAEWGLTGNLHSVLTDCPQRDERFGWTGDNHIAARALMYNFDTARFHEKWMDDHADVRSEHGYVADTIPYGYGSIPEDPTWGITQVTVPWHLYRHYGDQGVLERHYAGMRRYVDYWYEQFEDGVLPDEYGNYGDWLTFENNDGRRGLPLDLYNTAFQYHTTNLFARIADVLNQQADAKRYAERAETIAKGFNDAFFDPSADTYGPGTQSSYAVPLYFDLVPDDHVDAVVNNLVAKVESDGGKLQTGFLGTRPLINTLVDHGRAETAYEIVSQPERPGWVYMVRQGATTMWERWDSDTRIGDGMNSFNHSPFNFVSEWFYYALAGLRFDDSMSGNGSVEITPSLIEDLTWASGELETVNGTLASAWERTEDGYTLDAEIPWNTTATVRLPVDADIVRITETSDDVWVDATAADTLPDGVDAAVAEDGAIALSVGSGSYSFTVDE